jgi:hypothetical protein
MQAAPEDEQYERWHPMQGLVGCLDYESLQSTPEGLEIRLIESGTCRVLSVRFRSAIAYRSTDELNRYRTLRRLGPQGLLGWSFFIVRNSDWLRWLLEEIEGAPMYPEMTHYGVYSTDDCVDVLSERPPLVAWTGEVRPLLCD